MLRPGKMNTWGMVGGGGDLAKQIGAPFKNGGR